MATNDYYNPSLSQDQGHHNRFYDDQAPPPPPASSKPPRPFPSLASNPSPYNDYGYGHSYQNSQQTLNSDSGDYAGAGGRTHDSVSYADNIPLKTHAQTSASEEWVPQDVHDPVSPESQRPAPLQDLGQQPKKKARFLSRQTTWFVYIVSLIQICVFIAELVRNAQLTGSPIEIHPSFNPMIGPSPYVQIDMGARFVPCMRNVKCVQDQKDPPPWPCPWTTTTDGNSIDNKCTLQQLCGFPGYKVPNPDPAQRGLKLTQTPAPNQWFRFIVPMFLHAGLVHISFNLILQLIIGREMEQKIGSLRFALVYFSSGIFGFVLGGNFAPSGIASTGCSGCLFGVLALVLLDLFYNWNEEPSPWTDLIWIGLSIIFSFVLGLLPGLDNFSHIGGFLMGLALGICILRSPNTLRERTGQDQPPYTPMGSRKVVLVGGNFMKGFAKEPVGFFKARKPLWWAWWLVRAGSLIGVLVAFIILLHNFYQHPNSCHWCKYLSCLVSLSSWSFYRCVANICPEHQELVRYRKLKAQWMRCRCVMTDGRLWNPRPFTLLQHTGPVTGPEQEQYGSNRNGRKQCIASGGRYEGQSSGHFQKSN
jgi:membrane associated rhomboid family serine protease